MITLYNKYLKKYAFYGLSIFFGKGLEYLIFFLITYFSEKELYGEFEFYKKIVEFSSTILAFGTPALILTYTKSRNSKIYFYILSLLLCMIISVFGLLISSYFSYHFLMIPILYFATFHYSNSITQSYNLVFHGSSNSSRYKMLFSPVFAIVLLFFFYISEEKEKSLLYTCYPMFIFGTAYLVFETKTKISISFNELKKYIKPFKRQLGNSFTLVISALANTGFMMTDIFLIKIMEKGEYGSKLIGEYGFALMIANALLIIPMTITNVDIESYKKSNLEFLKSLKNNTNFSLIIAILLLLLYFILVKTIYPEYNSTVYLFLIIIVAKVVQSITIPYGVMLATKRFYLYNLSINIIVFVINIVLSVLLYNYFSIIGIAFASLCSLVLRYYLTRSKYSNL